MERKISIDKNKCIACGLCIKDCLLSCLEFGEENIPQYKEGASDMCLACKHCMAICPKGALSFGGINPEEMPPVSYANPEELLNLIKSRRSIRAFKNESLPEEKLQKITEMLPYAPTGGNVKALFFSVVETKEKMNKIIDTTYKNISKVSELSSFFKMAEKMRPLGEDIIYRGATSMVAVAVDKNKAVPGCENTDPIIALSYLDLYAQSLGLGTLWCDMALISAEKIPEVYSLLEIPDGYSLNYIILLGIPAVKYQRTVIPEPCEIKLI